MKLIETITLSSGSAASIDFTSIPSTYTDLLFKASLRATADVDYLTLRFNNSSTSFNSRYLLGTGDSGVQTGARDDNAFSATVVPSTWTSSTFSNLDLHIPNYTGSINKSFSIDAVTERNAGTAYMEIIVGRWSNTSVINQVTFYPGSGSFAQYSSISLYGILKGSGGATAA